MNCRTRSGDYETTITVERDTPDTDDTHEVQVTVTGDVTPVTKGRYHGPPELCFPDEGGEVEVIETMVNGQTIDLTPEEYLLAENALYLAAEAAIEDEVISRYESKLSFFDY